MGLDQYFYYISATEIADIGYFRKQHKLEDIMCHYHGGSESEQFGGIFMDLDNCILDELEEHKKQLVDDDELEDFCRVLHACIQKLQETYVSVFYRSSW